MNDEEYEDFKKRCETYGFTQSEMIRTSLENMVIKPVLKFYPVNQELLSKVNDLITEGKRIGNNLNQIVRALNSDSFDAGISGEIRKSLGELAEWKYEILRKVGGVIGDYQTFELEKLGPRGRRAILDLPTRRDNQQTASG